MTSNTARATSVFKQHISIFGEYFNLGLSGNSIAEDLKQIREVALANDEFYDRVKDFIGTTAKYASRFEYTEQNNIIDGMAKTLFAAAVRATVFQYRGIAPVRQHWLPLVFLREFSREENNTNKSRSVEIPGVYFNGEGLSMSFVIRDSDFIHEVSDGRGFYEDDAEKFFQEIETAYSQNKNDRISTHNPVISGTFFAVQSVRNPKAGSHRNNKATLSGIVEETLAILDGITGGELYGLTVRTKNLLPFTPYIPPFVQRLNGGDVYVLPMAPNLALVVSTRKLSDVSAASYVRRYRERSVNRTKESGGILFGVSANNIKRLIEY